MDGSIPHSVEIDYIKLIFLGILNDNVTPIGHSRWALTMGLHSPR